MKNKKSILDRRYQNEEPHHPIASALIKAMAKLDTEDEFYFKFGGDGDNGETLIALLSEVLEKNLVKGIKINE